jgi:RNA polymerase nonessential primary-like sigma factor
MICYDDTKTNEELFAGLPATRDELIARNRPFVIKMACRMRRPRDMDLDDVIQEGMLAVTHAVSGFKPGCGCKFMTYAGIAAFRRMSRYIQTNRTVVALPPVTRSKRARMWPHRQRAFHVASLNRNWHDGDTRDWAADVADRFDMRLTDDLIDAHDLLNCVTSDLTLDARQSEILRLRAAGYGLKEIGRTMGISKERVRQIEYRAIELIRERFHIEVA